MIARVDPGKQALQAVCIVPNRFIGVNHVDEIRDLATQVAGGGVRVEGHWGTDRKGPRETERRDFKDRSGAPDPHVLVTTDGKIKNYTTSSAEKFKDVKIIVVDEADYFCPAEGGRTAAGGAIKKFIDMVRKTNPTCQVVAVSATYSQRVNEWMRKPVHEIRQEADTVIPATINVFKHPILVGSDAGDDAKAAAIADMVQNDFTSGRVCKLIVFCDTTAQTDLVLKMMEELPVATGVTAVQVNGRMTKAKQNLALRRFNNKILATDVGGEANVMVCTNILGRGVNIKNCTHVVLWTIPASGGSTNPDLEAFVHRVGRTGRKEQGKAIVFFNPAEANDPKNLTALEDKWIFEFKDWSDQANWKWDRSIGEWVQIEM